MNDIIDTAISMADAIGDNAVSIKDKNVEELYEHASKLYDGMNISDMLKEFDKIYNLVDDLECEVSALIWNIDVLIKHLKDAKQ